MEFGKLSSVDEVDFRLPESPARNQEILQKSSGGELKIYLGGAKWGRKDWVGKLYPIGTKPADYLAHYNNHFNSIELNATHYNMFGNDLVSKWAGMVDKQFKFCPKIHQLISHRYRLKNALSKTEEFLDIMAHFGDKLGTIFLQMHANFRSSKFEDLRDYLESFPKGFKLAVELRHNEWFDAPLFDLLERLEMPLIITDTAGERQLVHNRITCDEVFVRFVGNNMHPSDQTRIDDWLDQIEVWKEQGLQKIWFFIHQHDEQYTPELARYTAKKMNDRFGSDLKVPGFTGLF